MGNYFLMSIRFNKRTAEDFGLVEDRNGIARSVDDRTQWQFRKLYDLGWGRENGYCKLPIPSFPELFDIALHGEHMEDQYGAAAVILDDYPMELLEMCEEVLESKTGNLDVQKLINIFELKMPINRCSIIGKTMDEIQSVAERWTALSVIAKNIEKD